MIAIGMLAWNQIRYTMTAVDSILRNSAGHDIQFFFVDNGSSDGTLAYMESVQARKKIVRNGENTGVTHGWNQALGMALESDADVIALINNDVLAGPGWLDSVAREIGKGELRYFLPNGDYKEPGFEDEARRRLPEAYGKVASGKCGWAMFFPRQAVPLFHPIPETMRLWYGDDFIHWKLESAGYKREVLLDCPMYHYISKSFYVYPGYVQQVAEDKKAFEAILGHPFV